MRLKTSGQRVCSFGLTNDAVESMGVGWMLDGWIEDGNDESNLEQITDLVSLMQSMRKFTGAKVWLCLLERCLSLILLIPELYSAAGVKDNSKTSHVKMMPALSPHASLGF